MNTSGLYLNANNSTLKIGYYPPRLYKISSSDYLDRFYIQKTDIKLKTIKVMVYKSTPDLNTYNMKTYKVFKAFVFEDISNSNKLNNQGIS